MRYEIDTAPTIQPVKLAEVKSQIRVTHSNDDHEILKLIDTATGYCEDITKRKFMAQTVLYYLDAWPGEDYILLPFGNLTSVTSVKYTDSDDSQSTMSSAEYSVDTGDGCRVVLDYGEQWPSDILATTNPIVIEYVCGWATIAEVPAPIMHAIKLMVAHWYEMKEPTIAGTIITSVPMAVDALLQSFRFWRCYE